MTIELPRGEQDPEKLLGRITFLERRNALLEAENLEAQYGNFGEKIR